MLFIAGQHGAPGEQQPHVGAAGTLRHGRRHSAKIAAADAIRSHATPSTSTRAKSRTAKAGPR